MKKGILQIYCKKQNVFRIFGRQADECTHFSIKSEKITGN